MTCKKKWCQLKLFKMTQFLSVQKSFRTIHIVISKESYLYSRKDTEYRRKIDTMKWLKSEIIKNHFLRHYNLSFPAKPPHVTLFIHVHLHSSLLCFHLRLHLMHPFLLCIFCSPIYSWMSYSSYIPIVADLHLCFYF